MKVIDVRAFVLQTRRPVMAIQTRQHRGRCVRANGIDIHYVEAGQGEPLLLLDNAMVSTNPIWAPVPVAYASFLGTLAEHFRVIAPDTRGSGKSVHSGGPISSSLLADDVAALIDALNLDRPLICGFSDGGETAMLVGIRHPGSVRAIVNHGGYDLFDPDPQAPAIIMTRQMLGGSAGATQADPDFSASRSVELRAMFELMKSDHDSAQGAGHWRPLSLRPSTGSPSRTATPLRTCTRSPCRHSSSPATGIRSARSRRGRPPTVRYRLASSRCCRTPGT
jgi:pimeloyl-ACP methyl ester carboxylesterase